MPRSSDPRNIFRDPDPTKKPFMFGRIPSTQGGHLVDVAFGITPEGQMVAERIGDNGLLSAQVDPFSYLAIYGSETELSASDIQELLAGMEEGRREKAKNNPRNIATPAQLKQKCADLIDAVNDAKVGRTKFGWNGAQTW